MLVSSWLLSEPHISGTESNGLFFEEFRNGKEWKKTYRLKCQILTNSEKCGLPTVTGSSFQDSKALKKLDNYLFFLHRHMHRSV